MTEPPERERLIAVPSSFPGARGRAAAPRRARRERLGALLVIALGCGGVVLGAVTADGSPEVIIGALLVVLGARALVHPLTE